MPLPTQNQRETHPASSGRKSPKDFPALTHLTESDWKRIRATADRHGLSVSALLRLVITQYLDGEPINIAPEALMPSDE